MHIMYCFLYLKKMKGERGYEKQKGKQNRPFNADRDDSDLRNDQRVVALDIVPELWNHQYLFHDTGGSVCRLLPVHDHSTDQIPDQL